MKHRKHLAILTTALLLALCLALTGCAGRRSVTTEDFTAACEAAGLTVTDSIDNFDPSTVVTALTVEDENITVGFFVFATASTARSNYAQMLDDAKTGRSGEKFVDSSEYNRFYYSDGEAATLLYRNGTTLLYAVGDDVQTLDALIDALDV